MGGWEGGRITNLGDSWPLLELFVEMFVVLYARQSSCPTDFHQATPRAEQKKEENEVGREGSGAALIPAWPGHERQDTGDICTTSNDREESSPASGSTRTFARP